RVLRILSDMLPKTLILVIDQGEEIFTLSQNADGQRARKLFFDFIAEFSRSSLSLKLVIALRGEYLGDFFDELKKRRYDQNQLDFFLLKELSAAELIEAITSPTSTSIPREYLQGRCQPAHEYKFEFEPLLPERIVDELLQMREKGGVRRHSVLPVLQIA